MHAARRVTGIRNACGTRVPGVASNIGLYSEFGFWPRFRRVQALASPCGRVTGRVIRRQLPAAPAQSPVFCLRIQLGGHAYMVHISARAKLARGNVGNVHAHWASFPLSLRTRRAQQQYLVGCATQSHIVFGRAQVVAFALTIRSSGRSPVASAADFER